MRVLVLHSDVGEDAAPDELDTLVTADAVASALGASGHVVRCAKFDLDPGAIDVAVGDADAVFNLVESVHGSDLLAAAAPALIERLGRPYTGSAAAPLALASDKTLSKRLLRSIGLPTPEWAEPPGWDGIDEGRAYIVKSATEDASIGLDDQALVHGRAAIAARAHASERRHGGRWFAEAYVEGREFNVALLAEDGAMRVLPIPEISFEDWPKAKPRIVGYSAKWHEMSDECAKTSRRFGLERSEPFLARKLGELARRACGLMDIAGYARVDFRVDAGGEAMILEVNPNPCLEPKAGFAAAALQGGLSYQELIARILDAALSRRRLADS